MKVLRGGCASRHEASFVISRPYGQENHVILLLRSKGEYLINDKHYSLLPGHAIIIAPKTRYSYSNPNGDYADDWIHFELESNDTLPHNLECNIPFLLNDFETCSALIRQLLWENAYTTTTYAERNINSLFSVLLNHLCAAYLSQEYIENSSPYFQQLKILRLHMQNTLTENHSIQTHAATLCISESYFQHLYSNLFGISFQNDLIRMRISYAKILLQTTDLPLENIAQTCGYASNVHFHRQFKKLMGITPAKYRHEKNGLK